MKTGLMDALPARIDNRNACRVGLTEWERTRRVEALWRLLEAAAARSAAPSTPASAPTNRPSGTGFAPRFTRFAVPPLISEDVWAVVQGRLAAPSKGGRPSARYLLRSLVWCGVCGMRLYGRASRGRRYYGCGSHDVQRAEKPCGLPPQRADELEGRVWAALREALRHPPGDPPAPESGPEWTTELEQVNVALARVNRSITRLLDVGQEDADLPVDALRTKLRELEAEKRALLAQQAQLHAMSARRRDDDTAADAVQRWCQLMATQFDNLPEEERATALRLALTKVVVFPDKTLRLEGIIPVTEVPHALPRVWRFCTRP